MTRLTSSPSGSLPRLHGSVGSLFRLVLSMGLLWTSGLLATDAVRGQTLPDTATRQYAGDSLGAWAQSRLMDMGPPGTGGEGDLEQSLERIRAMYFLSVDEGRWVERAKDSLRALRPQIPAGSPADLTARAYRGALEVVRAKHSRWPPNKLKYLERGSGILDALVSERPGNLEARYLRLASYMFLPFFLRRDESVAADLEVLVADLPDRPDAFPPYLYSVVLEFVLENGNLEEAQRLRFQEALADAASLRDNSTESRDSNG